MISPGRWLSVRNALLVSLCLNVALASYVGVQWIVPHRAAMSSVAPGRLLAILAQILPREDAARMRAIYEAKKAAVSKAQADYDQALSHAGDLVAAPTLDLPAFRAAVTQARDKRIVVGDLLIETVIDGFAEMSPANRQALVGRMRRR